MIKRLHVQNYWSLKDVELRLGTRNVLVGPNMSGKTNLLDSLRFLASISQHGVKRALMDRGGFQEVYWKGTGAEQGKISFELTLESVDQKTESKNVYEYEIVIQGSFTGLINIDKEKLTVKALNQTRTLIDFSNGRGKITHRDGSLVSTGSLDPTTSALESNIPGWEGSEVRRWVSMCRFYNLSPVAMKQANAPVAQNFLSETGDNFIGWMNTLRNTYPNSYDLITKVALDVFPELTEILTPPTQFGTTVMMTREKHLKRPIFPWRMSDGMVVFLGLLSLIYAPEELAAPLYCIEEPENHLHPKLLQTLIGVLYQRQEALGPNAGQVVVTTHSPYLVDRIKLDELIVIDKKEGATYCSYPGSKEHLRDLLTRKELGLGDLWYSGALGGR